ncbi:hypothetical protein EDC96DRAFT_453870, partial [Choanephora cucurbitarum]
KVLSNDELLYDPDMDDRDEAWVLKQIDLVKGNKSQMTIHRTHLFHRHERYADQFRAMFVRNCHTVPGERYKMKSEDGQDEYYAKVTCETCGIHVAMLDEDEVYHFFNVVAT